MYGYLRDFQIWWHEYVSNIFCPAKLSWILKLIFYFYVVHQKLQRSSLLSSNNAKKYLFFVIFYSVVLWTFRIKCILLSFVCYICSCFSVCVSRDCQLVHRRVESRFVTFVSNGLFWSYRQSTWQVYYEI